MRAVLIEINVEGVDPEAGLDGLRNQLVPAIKAMPGFQSGTWLTGNEHGRGLSLTIWDTDERARAFADRGPVPARKPAPRSSAASCVRSAPPREVDHSNHNVLTPPNTAAAAGRSALLFAPPSSGEAKAARGSAQRRKRAPPTTS